MPDTTSPKVNMANEDTRSLFASRKDRTLLGRKWSCPKDDMVASYVDGALGNARKKWVEFHLAGCRRCRLLLAGVIKVQRDAYLPSVPPELKCKALGFVGRKSLSTRWIWAPAGVLVVLALLAVGAIVSRKQEQLIIQSPTSLSAPLIAKSEPSPRVDAPVREIERKRTPVELLPSLIFPQAGTIVSREQVQFSWKLIAQSRYYEIRVVTSDGDLVWQGQTKKSDLQPPSDVAMRDGSYFVWITAYLADGRVAKSSPVKFVVRR